MTESNKVVIITGASSGIGARTAIVFASLGYDMVLTGRDVDKLNAVCKNCQENKSKTIQIVPVQAFMEKDEDLENIIKTALIHFDRIDVLINNAANAYDTSCLDEINRELFDSIININLWAPIYLTKLAVPHLAKTRGCVLNCSSVLAQTCPPEATLYGISKAGLNMFTKIICQELGPMGVRIISVSPGHVKTPLWNRLSFTADQRDYYLDYVRKLYPLERIATEDDIAQTFAFLASHNASFITGTDIVVDGGSLCTQPSALPRVPQIFK